MPASLTDVTPIPGHANIYRAKLLNDDVRKQVLGKSKTLRGTAYSRVYISRDLTYAQRAELFARRQARRSGPTSQPDAAPAATASAPNPMPDGAETAPPASNPMPDGAQPAPPASNPNLIPDGARDVPPITLGNFLRQ